MATFPSHRWHILPTQHDRSGTLDSAPRDYLKLSQNKARVRHASGSQIRPSGSQNNVRGFVRKSPEVWSNSSLSAKTWSKLGRPNSHTSDHRMKLQTDSLSKSNKKLAGVKKPANASSEEVHFALTPEIPGIPIVYRNENAKAINLERMSLDRRNLPVIPLLEGEESLRQLYLQNNTIQKIDNLLSLPNLIFLDLCNNHIEKLENLHHVPNLRVLMMGSNRLTIIENLECLKKLDVLDLHSNKIEQMQNLNDLKELRILNLAGNLISTVESIDKLMQLTELNLRRNRISSIKAIGALPSLSRVYLSNNNLETFDSIEPLFQVVSINELRLDLNGCTSNVKEYRARMIRNFPSLNNLDSVILTDADREEAFLQTADNKGIDTVKEVTSVHAISCVTTHWENRAELEKFSKDSQCVPFPSSWADPARKSLTSVVNLVKEEAKPTSLEEQAEHCINAGSSKVNVCDEDQHIDNKLSTQSQHSDVRSAEASKGSSSVIYEAREKAAIEKNSSDVASDRQHAARISNVTQDALDIEKKIAAFDHAWKDILLSIVKETLRDIERHDNFMSGCLDIL
ncbi:putative leucine-rich repeat domain superfamily [Plasmopara halstedii]